MGQQARGGLLPDLAVANLTTSHCSHSDSNSNSNNNFISTAAAATGMHHKLRMWVSK
jgi:hypothetical protein